MAQPMTTFGWTDSHGSYCIWYGGSKTPSIVKVYIWHSLIFLASNPTTAGSFILDHSYPFTPPDNLVPVVARLFGITFGPQSLSGATSRPIVEFAIDNVHKLRLHQQRLERAQEAAIAQR